MAKRVSFWAGRRPEGNREGCGMDGSGGGWGFELVFRDCVWVLNQDGRDGIGIIRMKAGRFRRDIEDILLSSGSSRFDRR